MEKYHVTYFHNTTHIIIGMHNTYNKPQAAPIMTKLIYCIKKHTTVTSNHNKHKVNTSND